MKEIPVGTKFGAWETTGPVTREANPQVECACACGTKRLVYAWGLLHGTSTNCGCEQKAKHIRRLTTHGMSKTPLYACWRSMKHRCLNPHDKRFKNYGGRGIAVCERWRNSFESFCADMGPCPDGHSLDRINVERGYEPGNCRWATEEVQRRNRRVVAECKRGHSFASESTSVTPAGRRRCTICFNLRRRERRTLSQ